MTVVATTTLEMLQRIYSEMLDTEAVLARAGEAHMRAFTAQMQDKLGAGRVEMDEPYRQAVQANTQLAWIQKLEDRFNALDDSNTPPAASDLGDLEDYLARRRVAAEIILKQRYDQFRQQQFGIRYYIWRTQGDDRVRASHAVNEGVLFTWDQRPPTGHPGEEPGCRCWAEPTILDPMKDAIEPVYPELLLPALRIPAIIKGVFDKVSKRIDQRRAEESTKPKPPEKPAETPAQKPNEKPPLRRDYEKEVRNLEKIEKQMRKEGRTDEEIARELSKQRREIGEKYKDITPKEMRDRIHQRNVEKYGDKSGPSIDELRRRGKSWDDIIESAKRPGGEDLF